MANINCTVSHLSKVTSKDNIIVTLRNEEEVERKGLGIKTRKIVFCVAVNSKSKDIPALESKFDVNTEEWNIVRRDGVYWLHEPVGFNYEVSAK